MNYDEDKKDIIEYGAFVVIHTIFCTALSLIIAYIFGLFMPAAIILAVVGLLRIFSGGARCTSPQSMHSWWNEENKLKLRKESFIVVAKFYFNISRQQVYTYYR